MAQWDVYKFDLEGTFSTKRWCTSFYLTQNEADSGGDSEAIATNLAIQAKYVLWTIGLKTLLAADIASDRHKCQRFGPTKATPNFVQYAAEAGDIVGTSIANSSSVVATKYPTFWDRDFICRNYLPPPPVADEIYNRLSVAAVASWQAAVFAAIDATLSITVPESLTFTQVCQSISRYKKFIDPEEPPSLWTSTFTKVKNAVVQTVLGTQRRRRPPRDSAPG